MQGSKRPIVFCLVVAAVGLGVAVASPAFGVQWCCAWLGLAALFVGTRHRFPRFVPAPPPAKLDSLGFRDHEIEGITSSPWYLLLPLATTWACTMLVPLMTPSRAAFVSFGVAIAVVLLGGAAWLRARHRRAALLAAQLLDPPEGVTVIRATVAGDTVALRRTLHWFQIAGTRQSTEHVETVHGNTVEVTTTVATSTTYGFCDEQRKRLRLEAQPGPVEVALDNVRWAATRERLPKAPPMPEVKRNAGHELMVNTYVGQARVWEQELVGPGDCVAVAGRLDPAQQEISAVGELPVVVFGVRAGQDPLEVLAAERTRRRWPLLAQVGLAIAALVVGFVG